MVATKHVTVPNRVLLWVLNSTIFNSFVHKESGEFNNATETRGNKNEIEGIVSGTLIQQSSIFLLSTNFLI